MARHDRGFTLIELMIVLAIIGIIASIAIPGLMNAIDRGRQKQTMADIRTVGNAVESYAIDCQIYPAVGAGTVDAQIRPHLEPLYVRKCPLADGWANPLQWQSDGAGGPYSLVSYGKDGLADASVPTGPTQNFAADIYFTLGQFTQWPEGLQK